MMRTGLLWVGVATVIIVTGGCSKTEGTKSSAGQPAARAGAVGTGGAGANVKNDADFVRDVATMNMAEVDLSRMALDKAAGPDVKTFAQMMIDDHGAAGEQLKSILSGQQWPGQLDDKHKKTADELAKEQGGNFDHEYVKAMVEGHQNLAALLESRLDIQSVAEWKTAAAGRTQSKALPHPNAEMADVKVRPNKSESDSGTKINQWAADTYPIVQKHLDTARDLENATKKRSTN